jgi:hypothetical protein
MRQYSFFLLWLVNRYTKREHSARDAEGPPPYASVFLFSIVASKVGTQSASTLREMLKAPPHMRQYSFFLV